MTGIMDENFTKEWVEDLVARILEEGIEAAEDSRKNKDDVFLAGRRLAYYEVLDILHSALIARDLDPSDYGLGMDLLKTIE